MKFERICRIRKKVVIQTKYFELPIGGCSVKWKPASNPGLIYCTILTIMEAINRETAFHSIDTQLKVSNGTTI